MYIMLITCISKQIKLNSLNRFTMTYFTPVSEYVSCGTTTIFQKIPVINQIIQRSGYMTSQRGKVQIFSQCSFNKKFVIISNLDDTAHATHDCIGLIWPYDHCFSLFICRCNNFRPYHQYNSWAIIGAVVACERYSGNTHSDHPFFYSYRLIIPYLYQSQYRWQLGSSQWTIL